MTRLGHVLLGVRDLDRAIDFYTEFLELEVRERIGEDYALLAGDSGRHHDLALRAVGPDAPGPGTGVGLGHIAFEVADREAFARVYRRTTDAGVPVDAADHGISWGLYFNDPDGNSIEVYRDTRNEPTGRDRWEGRTRRLSEKTILSSS